MKGSLTLHGLLRTLTFVTATKDMLQGQGTQVVDVVRNVKREKHKEEQQQQQQHLHDKATTTTTTQNQNTQ